MEPAIRWSISAVFHALEIAAHVLGPPRGITGQFCDRVPVIIMRIDQDHRIMRSAAAQAPGARIENSAALGPKLRVAFLLLLVGVMSDEEVPFDRRVL